MLKLAFQGLRMTRARYDYNEHHVSKLIENVD